MGYATSLENKRPKGLPPTQVPRSIYSAPRASYGPPPIARDTAHDTARYRTPILHQVHSHAPAPERSPQQHHARPGGSSLLLVRAMRSTTGIRSATVCRNLHVGTGRCGHALLAHNLCALPTPLVEAQLAQLGKVPLSEAEPGTEVGNPRRRRASPSRPCSVTGFVPVPPSGLLGSPRTARPDARSNPSRMRSSVSPKRPCQVPMSLAEA